MTAVPARLPGSFTRLRLILVALTFLAAASLLLAWTLATSDRPTTAVVWGGLALAALAFGLLCLLGGALNHGLGLGRWKIGSLMLVWYALAYGVATVTWSQPQAGVATEISVPNVLRALWLVAVGLAAWAAGYLIGPGMPAQRFAARAVGALSRRFGGQVRGASAPWILYCIGIAANLGNTATSGNFGYVGNLSSAVTTVSSYGGVLGTVSLCAPLGVAAAAMRVFIEHRRHAWITLVILFSAEVAFGAIAGVKGNFIIAVLAVAIPFSVSRRRLPKIPLILSALVFLLVVIPFTGAYRSVVRQGSVVLTPSQAVSAAPKIFQQTVTDNNAASVLSSSFTYLMGRIREIDDVAIIVQRTPGQIGFRSPLQLIGAPVAGIVPRVLWPGKPLNLTGDEFSQEYFDLPSTMHTSTPDTFIGGLYLYGGWLPMLAGMLLFGCGIRLLDDQLDVQANRHGIFLVVLLFPQLVTSETDWGSILSSILATGFVWLLAIAVTFRRDTAELPRGRCSSTQLSRPGINGVKLALHRHKIACVLRPGSWCRPAGGSPVRVGTGSSAAAAFRLPHQD